MPDPVVVESVPTNPVTVPAGTAAPAPTPVAAVPPVPAEPAKVEPLKLAAKDGTLADVAAIEAFANEHKLSADAAAKALDLADAGIKGYVEKAQQKFAAERDGWIQSITADKDFGGDKLDANKAYANKVLSTYASPEFVKALQESGYDAHPELFKMLAKMGKDISEPTGMVKGSLEQVPAQRDLRSLYA